MDNNNTPWTPYPGSDPNQPPPYSLDAQPAPQQDAPVQPSYPPYQPQAPYQQGQYDPRFDPNAQQMPDMPPQYPVQFDPYTGQPIGVQYTNPQYPYTQPAGYDPASNYGNQYYEEAKKKGTASMVLGICSLTMQLLAFLVSPLLIIFFIAALATGIIGTIMGAKSRKLMNNNNARATAGLVMSIISLVITVLMIILVIIIIAVISTQITSDLSNIYR